MSTFIRKEFEEFIQEEMPGLLSEGKEKELHECWVAWVRGYDLALGYEVKKLEQYLARQKEVSDRVNFWVSIVISILCLSVIALLIMDNFA